MLDYTDVMPTNKYVVERKNENNKFEVAFYDLDTVEQHSRTEQDGTTHTFYSVKKYLIELVNINHIEDNYNNLLALARNKEIEKLSSEIRAKRDKLLADTDWTQVNDNALSNAKKEAYRVYRQALRDITEQANFPYNVVFPTFVYND